MKSTNFTQRYISRELVHFVGRGKTDAEKFELLVKILKEGWLLHPPFNPNISGNLSVKFPAKISNHEMFAPEIVCLADIPLDDLQIHAKKYSRFGVTFGKELVVNAGGAPIHYLPLSSSVTASLIPKHIESKDVIKSEAGDIPGFSRVKKSLAEHFDDMMLIYQEVFDEISKSSRPSMGVGGSIDRYSKIVGLRRFLDFHLFCRLKFFDHSLPDDHEDNFYFEREWRIVGNLKFQLDDVQTVIFPSEYAKQFRQRVPEYFGAIRFID